MVITARYSIWEHANRRERAGTPAKIAREIRETVEKSPPGQLPRYDWVIDHAWSWFKRAPGADENAEDMPQDQGGKTIMFAPWPKPLDDDFKSHYGLTGGDEKHVEARNELVTQGRNLRRTASIAAGKKIKYILKPAGALAAHDAEVLKLLLNAEAFETDANYQPGKNTVTARTGLGDLFLPLEGLIDKAAETARLKKELEKIEAETAKVEQKLANPNFTQKVPAKVLEEHKQRLADWQSKREHVKTALAALG